MLVHGITRVVCRTRGQGAAYVSARMEADDPLHSCSASVPLDNMQTVHIVPPDSLRLST